jgi:hypothetical protein
MQATDNTPFTTGAPGIGMFNGHGSGAVNNSFGFSSFTASNTGSPYTYSQSTYYVYSQSSYVSYAYSQSAYTGGNTITAASCSQTDVQNALNAVAADGTTVKIPAGNCTWTSPGGGNCTGTVTYDQNVRPYSVTIQGQTTCSGTPASSCVDNTTITDNITRTNCDAAALSLNTVLGKSLRLSGITFTKVNSNSNLTYGGSLSLNGTSTAVRLDHAHFHDINSTAMSERGIKGVADHIVVDVHDEFIRPANAGNGDAAFAAPTGFGTSDFFFLEDSTINGPAQANGGGTTDCFAGGKFVARHNQMNYTSIGEHGVGHDTVTGNDRGCRAVEIYQNTFNNSVNGLSTQFNMLFLAGGTAIDMG